VGVLISERPVVKKMVEIFESDWAKTPAAKHDEPGGATTAAEALGRGDGKKGELDDKASEKAIA
jgi:hypothetical protein